MDTTRIAGQDTVLQWIPNEVYKRKDYIPIEGGTQCFSVQMTHETHTTETLSGEKSTYQVLLTAYCDVDIWKPSNGVAEIGVGESGVLVAVNQRDTAIHASGIVEKIRRDDEDNVHYGFRLTRVQIGTAVWLVVRVDMGDGTYAELIMTEAEYHYFDPKKFRERKLRQSVSR